MIAEMKGAERERDEKKRERDANKREREENKLEREENKRKMEENMPKNKIQNQAPTSRKKQKNSSKKADIWFIK